MKSRTEQTESDATETMTTRKSQSGKKKPTSAGDAHEPKPRVGTKERCKRRSLQRVLGARSSNPIAAMRREKGRRSISQPGGEQKNADQMDVMDAEKQPGMGQELPKKYKEGLASDFGKSCKRCLPIVRGPKQESEHFD